MNIRPLGNNVVIKQEKVEEKSKMGIILTTNKEDQTLTGVVEAVGNSVEEIKIGDKVVFAPFSGKELGGRLLIESTDIMGIVEEDKKEDGNCVCTAACGAELGHNKKPKVSPITKEDLRK